MYGHGARNNPLKLSLILFGPNIPLGVISMRARVFSAVVALAMPLAGPVAARAQQSGDFTYSTNAFGVTITKYTGSAPSVTIPDTIDGLPVTVIGANSFQSGTFSNVTMGNAVTAIRTNAFRSCLNLTNVTFGGGLLSIEYGGFYSCTRLADITLPSNVSTIGILAFGACSSLATIEIPASVATIGSSAFTQCSNLTSIDVNGNNIVYSSLDGVLFNKGHTTLVQFPGGIKTGYIVPDGVTHIGVSAFQYCQLTALTIPESVTNIYQQALGNCLQLAVIDVDANNLAFRSIDGVLFDHGIGTLVVCPAGRSGTYEIPNNITELAIYAFYQCRALTNIIIPEAVTTIGPSAFFGCSGLESLDIPNSVTSIGHTAFGATGLRSLTLPISLTNIPDTLFFGCRQLTNVVIPNSVTSIGSTSFQGCHSLVSIVIPPGVLTIGASAFFALSNLKSVYFSGDAPGLGSSSVFSGANNLTVYYLPGTVGWSSTFGGRPTAIWQPLIQTPDPSFGIRTNQFGFTITWASGRTVVVDASTDLAAPTWVPISTNALPARSATFTDPDWTNYPTRFYRVRSQ